MKFTTILAVAGLTAAVPIADLDIERTGIQANGENAADGVPEYFLIRHAEKNSDGTISSQGMDREQCLVKLFGKDSQYNIQHIMVQNPHTGDARSQRPYNTTLPLAQSLGITIDHPCELTDPSCAGKAAREYSGPGNVLIAWEHVYLPQVAEAIGGGSTQKNPSNHFDYIYHVPAPYNEITISSEKCPGLD